MKFSLAWLKRYIETEATVEEVAATLNAIGLEVEAIEDPAARLAGFRVARVLTAARHPDADKLQVLTVDTGDGDPLQVVCGAPNARAGLVGVLGLPGATVPANGMVLKVAAVRGVESNGMMCSTRELELGDDHDGIIELPEDAPVGTDFAAYHGASPIIEVAITPNRPDCMGLFGIARDLAAAGLGTLKPMKVEPVEGTFPCPVEIRTDDPEGCPAFYGRVIKGVKNGPSPQWLQDQLLSAGQRPISALVDITNYLMLGHGRPAHAYDLARLSGPVVARRARDGETVVALNEKRYTLDGEMTVIADDNGPLALAGIMGGRPSAVSEDTRDLFLECAFFSPLAIVGRARRYGLHTDASHRYERGVDPALQQRALERATALILEIAGGEAGPLDEILAEDKLPEPATIELSAERVARLLGAPLDDANIVDILERLGMTVTETGAGQWSVRAPSWRFDMAIQEDLIEELARVHGYENLPSRVPAGTPAGDPAPEKELPLRRLGDTLRDRGYMEAITYSFVAPELQAKVDPDHAPLALLNPISADLGVMRTGLIAGLLSAAERNVNRQCSRLRLFETGLRFVPGPDGLAQEPMVAGLLYGSAQPAHWEGKPRPVDFYDLKGDVEALLALSQPDAFAFRPGSHPALHPGQCAEVTRDGRTVGHLGRLHPRLAAQLDLPKGLYLFELALEPLRLGRLPHFEPVSDQPRVQRDLAFVVDADVPAGEMVAAAHQACDDRLRQVHIFDLYQGDNIEAGRKSLALTLTFQDPSRTLKDAQVNDLVEAVVSQLKQQFKATLRD